MPWLIAILALAFGLRIANAVVFQGLNAPPNAGAQPDQLDYEVLAHHLSSGEGYCMTPGQPTAFRPPGTPLTLAPVYFVFGRSYAAGRIWFSLLGMLTCLFVALLGRAAFGGLAGLLAAAWLAVYPGNFYYAMHFLSETPFSFWLALSAMLTFFAAQRRSLLLTVLAGASIGMAALTRPQALLLVPLAWMMAPLIARGFRKVAWGRLSLGTLAFALVLAPWIARNVVVLGHPTMSTVGGCTFWGAHNETIMATGRAGGWIPVTDLASAEYPMSGDEFQIDKQCWSYGKEWVRENLSAMPVLTYKKLKRSVTPFVHKPSPLAYWAFLLSWVVTMPFLLVGLVLAWRAHPLAAATSIVSLLATLATVVVFYGDQRFRDGVASSFAVPVGLAVAVLIGRFRPRSD